MQYFAKKKPSCLINEEACISKCFIDFIIQIMPANHQEYQADMKDEWLWKRQSQLRSGLIFW